MISEGVIEFDSFGSLFIIGGFSSIFWTFISGFLISGYLINTGLTSLVFLGMIGDTGYGINAGLTSLVFLGMIGDTGYGIKAGLA